MELSFFLHSWICLGAQLELPASKSQEQEQTRCLINNAPQIDLRVGWGAPEWWGPQKRRPALHTREINLWRVTINDISTTSSHFENEQQNHHKFLSHQRWQYITFVQIGKKAWKWQLQSYMGRLPVLQNIGVGSCMMLIRTIVRIAVTLKRLEQYFISSLICSSNRLCCVSTN